MARTEQKPVFGIYLKDFNAQIVELGERMGIPLSAKTRFGVTGDYMEKNPHAATAEKCFYMEIVMLEEHVLFRAFTQRFDDASKILFIDGVKKELYKLAVQILAQQQAYLINHEQVNEGPKLDLEDAPGYPAKPKLIPRKASQPEGQDGKEDPVQSDDGGGLVQEGDDPGNRNSEEDDKPKSTTPRKPSRSSKDKA